MNSHFKSMLSAAEALSKAQRVVRQFCDEKGQRCQSISPHVTGGTVFESPTSYLKTNI